MIQYLLDTNHASALWRYDPQFVQRSKTASGATFSLCRPSVGELWFMVFNSKMSDENSSRMATFIGRLLVWEYDNDAAMEFGRIRTELRRKGRPGQDIDLQIAAIARVHDLTVLTADKHFQYIENLKHENWLVR